MSGMKFHATPILKNRPKQPNGDTFGLRPVLSWRFMAAAGPQDPELKAAGGEEKR